MNVFDASALLCLLLREPGWTRVRAELSGGAACSAVNWSEVVQKAAVNGLPWAPTRATLLGYGLVVEPVTAELAEDAAGLWTTRPHLSLADRICLATAARLGAVVWTTDRAWGTDDPVRQVR